MGTSDNRLSRCALLLAAVFCLAAGLLSAVPAGATTGDPREAARIGALVREGRRAAALAQCRTYVATQPDDAVMLYNLACLENTHGDQDAAVSAYRAALAAGFMRLAAAENDPDLAGPIRAAVTALNSAAREEAAARAAEQGLALEYGAWSVPRVLHPHGRMAVADVSAGGARLRLSWQATGLEFEITGDGPWLDMFTGAESAPWNGGPGLVLSIGIDAPEGGRSGGPSYLFAFGMESKGGAGGLWVPDPGHWQQVLELAPKIRIDSDGRLRMTGLVPWQALAPYDPVVDTPLGINATLLRHDASGLHRASLVETGDTLDPRSTERRLAVLDLQTSTLTEDVFTGRVATTLSTTGPVAVDLVAVSTVAGDATLRLDFMDGAGRSVLPKGAITSVIPVEAGANRIARQADFSSLDAGGYVVRAELDFPSGHTGAWASTVLQLPPGWDRAYRDQLQFVALAEQQTVRHLLGTIAAAAERHRPRDNPAPIINTLIDVDRMVADAVEQGSILPDRGSFVFVYPGPGGEDRLCRMYMPPGRDIADGINPILVLGHGRMPAARVAERIGRNYEFGDVLPTLKTGDDDRFPVYLVPEFRPDPADPRGSLLAEAQAARAWAMTYFGVRALSLVGIDALAGEVLALSRTAPITLRGLLLCAGEDLQPWPQATDAFVREQVGPSPGALPVTWLEFSQESSRGGQGPQILQALQDEGWTVTDVSKVRGGLNVTQVADRVVRWAEGLR